MEREKNPCLWCDCYDPDLGCTMSPLDKSYACLLENREIHFFLQMVPPTVTQQEHKITMRNGKPFFYEPMELKTARAKLRAYLSRHKPETPFQGAVRLTVRWIFPVKGKHRDGEYRTTRPDTDNLQKMLKDIMTELHFWKDDAQVASELVEKFWGNLPGIFVKIEDLSNG